VWMRDGWTGLNRLRSGPATSSLSGGGPSRWSCFRRRARRGRRARLSQGNRRHPLGPEADVGVGFPSLVPAPPEQYACSLSCGDAAHRARDTDSRRGGRGGATSSAAVGPWLPAVGNGEASRAGLRPAEMAPLAQLRSSLNKPVGDWPRKAMAENIPGALGARQIIAVCARIEGVSTERRMAKMVHR